MLMCQTISTLGLMKVAGKNTASSWYGFIFAFLDFAIALSLSYKELVGFLLSCLLL